MATKIDVITWTYDNYGKIVSVEMSKANLETFANSVGQPILVQSNKWLVRYDGIWFEANR
jgi:hypothetical protein